MGHVRPGEFPQEPAPRRRSSPAKPFINAKTLIMILFCMQDFDGIVSATYANNWAEYLVQLVGPDGAVALLVLLWLDSTCATASCFMSAQRVTFAISRDGVLPFSRYFRRLSSRRIPVHAAFLVFVLGVAITCAVIGSTVAFTAITATATIVTNVSYLIPIVARHTIGRRDFQPARFNLGRYSTVVGAVSAIYIMFIFVVLVLPQLYPVTAVSSILRITWTRSRFWQRKLEADPLVRSKHSTMPLSALQSSLSLAWLAGYSRSVSAADTGSRGLKERLRTILQVVVSH